jgi:hypothetical protein
MDSRRALGASPRNEKKRAELRRRGLLMIIRKMAMIPEIPA